MSTAEIHDQQKGKEKNMGSYANRKRGSMKQRLFFTGLISAVVIFVSCATPDGRHFSKRSPMATADTLCTIVPYFKAHADKLDDFKKLCTQLVEKANEEPKCLYYGYTFNGDQAHCREGYVDADAVLAHLENIGPLLQEALKVADITRLEVHGPEAELAKLREPMAGLNPQFFTLECGFRR
jgi:quinol monooxygenase YgiN